MLKQHGGEDEYDRNMQTDMNTQTKKESCLCCFSK